MTNNTNKHLTNLLAGLAEYSNADIIVAGFHPVEQDDLSALRTMAARVCEGIARAPKAERDEIVARITAACTSEWAKREIAARMSSGIERVRLCIALAASRDAARWTALRTAIARGKHSDAQLRLARRLAREAVRQGVCSL